MQAEYVSEHLRLSQISSVIAAAELPERDQHNQGKQRSPRSDVFS